MKKSNKSNEKLIKINPNDQSFKKNELNGKKKSTFGLMKITLMVVAVTAGVLVAFMVYVVKKSKNNNSNESDMDQSIIDASMI